MCRALLGAVLLVAAMAPGPVAAQETPRAGGELVFVVPAEPPSYDAHREETFALVHPAAPHYSTLLRVDPFDRSGTKLVGDLAESWTVGADGRTYAFKLRRDVKFHDGSVLGSRDVKASYDKIIFPPPGIASNRKGEYVVVEAIEAPDPGTVVFRLKWPSASFLASLASPFNWIYKADILARDMRWYEKNVMGTGPFVFVEYVKGFALDRQEEPELLGSRQALTRQWRQIGLNVKLETLELATVYAEIRGGNFDVAADFHCSYIVEPDLSLFKFQSTDVSHVNYSRYTDRTLDELYQRQSRATDREERRRAIREFEKRLLDDEVRYIYTFQWHRIVPHSARVRGWTITPSHFLNNQLDTVWLAE